MKIWAWAQAWAWAHVCGLGVGVGRGRGRAFEDLGLGEKGQVVTRRVDMELGGLSDGMQRTVQQAVGEIPIRRVAEVYEDGRTVYRVVAKAPNQAVELVLDSEGKVIRSETMVRETKP